MKLELDERIANEIEIAIQKKQQREYKLMASYVPKIDGYKIFKYNKKTKELSLAKYRESDTFVIGKSNSKKIDIESDCVYIEALNKENALKRLRRGDVIFSC